MPEVNEPGIYTLILTHLENGCMAALDVGVDQDIAAPSADAGPAGTLTCGITTLQLQGNGSGANQTGFFWKTTGGNILSGIDSPNPTIDASGR